MTKGWKKKPRTAEQIEQAFWAKVDIGDHCWNWTASKNPDGYGGFWWKGRLEKAHRVAWEIGRAPIPEGLQVLHICDNPGCVRLSHLFLGTVKTNMRDRAEKERHHMTKLTAEDVLTIRDLCAKGYLQKDCAVLWGVDKATVNDLVLRKTWRHL